MDNFAITGFRSLGLPARIDSLYRLSYPGVEGLYVLVEGKAIPDEVWIGPEGSRSFETSRWKTVGA